ncbi:unnamed protein product [Bathycoccus prasinos]
MQPVTFAPSFKHISGSWFPFLHAKYAAVWFAHLFCKCLCEANKTLDVDTTPRAAFSAEKTSSKSSSFSLEPIVKPKIKWSAADLPEISPVAPFLISEDEREAGAASSKQSS